MEWAAAIRVAGFEADLDTDFDPEAFSGFLPCMYKARTAGFEYYRGTLEPSRQATLGVPATQSCFITFSTRSSYREFATSVICAAVLASKSGGTLYDADGTTVIPAGSEIAWARECEEGIQNDIRLQDSPRVPADPSRTKSASKPWWRFW